MMASSATSGSSTTGTRHDNKASLDSSNHDRSATCSSSTDQFSTPGGIGEFLSANPEVRTREVFRCDKSEVIRAESLRGKCIVIQYTEPQSARRFTPSLDTYFTLLGYNPDTRRLATIQGEIRIGQSHQAKLPECNPSVPCSARVSRDADEGIGGGDAGEEQVWRPGAMSMQDLQTYLTAARSMVASFASMCDRQSPDESAESAKRDENTQLALNNLHQSNYDKNISLQELVKCTPLVRSVDRRWNEEDSKKFMKGLRVYGKNFFKIRKEFLPEKDTKELVEYYYYWKKTPMATTSKSANRRRARKPTSSKATPSTGEASSESEEADGAETYLCFRCDAETSSRWHYVEDHGFVCDTCKINYRKYGDENGEKIPEYLFRPVDPAYRRPPPRRRSRPSNSPDETAEEDANTDRKSPSASSTSSGTSSKQTPKKRPSPGKSKRPASVSDTESTPKKKKTEQEASPDSLQSEAGRQSTEEDNGNLGDVENNQDDASVNSPMSNAGSEEMYKLDPNRRSPTPIPCQEPAHQSKNAHFIRCWKRGENSCARIDVYYIPKPDSTMAQRRQQKLTAVKPKQPLLNPSAAPKMPAPSTAHSQQHQQELKPVKSEPMERVVQQAQHRQMPPATRITSPHMSSHQPPKIPSSRPPQGQQSPRMTPGQHRMTPRSQPGPDHPMLSTPALSQLSHMASRPSPQAMEEMTRQMNMQAVAAATAGAGAGGAPGLAAGMGDPMMLTYRMMKNQYPVELLDRMCPPEMRERWDMMLKAQEMEVQNAAHREKMMMAATMAMAGAGPGGGAPTAMDSKAMLEAQMVEMQRKFGPMMQGFPHPGLLPPTSMASGMTPHDLLARERAEKERLQKLGYLPAMNEHLQALGSPVERLSAERLQAERLAGLQVPAAHAHTHTHTHLHLHQQAAAEAAAMAAASSNPFLAQQFLQNIGAGGAPEAAMLARGFPPFMPPPGYPGAAPGTPGPTSAASSMNAAMREELGMLAGRPDVDPRELLAHQMLAGNPSLAAAMAAQHEAHRRQIMEHKRESQLSHHMPH